MVAIPETIAKRIREKARAAGLTTEEYLIELVSQDLDPPRKAYDYINTASELISRAREELNRGEIRQAAEKVWGATALAIKAYALWRDGRRLASHRELWEYKNKVANEIGEWVRAVFQRASSLHMCFYEGWCTKQDVEDVLEDVERLVSAIRCHIAPDSGYYAK